MKTYVGDGVYADFDGFQIVLTTENGIETTNTIYLDPSGIEALIRYALRISVSAEQVAALIESEESA